MKIAVSGTHKTGKTTLVEELCRWLPDYTFIDEPYYILEENGHLFSHTPTIEDFEIQLECSLDLITNNKDENVIFDRCPLDILAYILVLEKRDLINNDEWISQIKDAIKKIDLIVFIPIEEPDLICFDEFEFTELREHVNEKLCELLFDNEYDLDFESITVKGSINDRQEKILQWLRIN